MPATSQTGSEANTFGRTAGKRIAQYLNASNISGNSNECTVNGVPIVIKCARLGNGSVGVSHDMQNRIHAVLGAFANPNGSYDLYWLNVAQAIQHMRPRKGKRIGLIDKAVFVNAGQLMQTIPPSAV